jgi:hypothetical protein
MSGVKLRLTCLVRPDDKPDEHLVEVKIDDDETVMFLKKLIKDEHAPMLDKVAARDLVLWKCSGLPDGDDLAQTLKTLQFDGSHDRLVRLASARFLNISEMKTYPRNPYTSLLSYLRLVSVVPIYSIQGYV